MRLLTLAGIIAVLIAGAATAVAGHAAGEREAIADLRAKTLGLAQLRIQPAVTDALLTGNITAIGEVGAAVRHYVLDNSAARVKIWNREGTIVYSDEPRLIGTHQALQGNELATIRSNTVRSRVSDPSRPENRFERSAGKLLEVDLRIITPNRQPLALEVFYRYSAVESAGGRVWNRFAPFVLGALAALAVVLILIASLLARRLRRRRSVPELETEAETETETEPIALEPFVPEPFVPEPVVPEPFVPEPVVVESLAPYIAEPTAEPDPGTDLVGALSQLVARTNGGGIASTLDTHDVHNMIPPAVAEMLFRATEETLRNHDHSTPVTVRVSDRDHVATLDVFDKAGEGEPAAHPTAGHIDLGALTDLVADAGGRLVVDAAENGGTRVHVEVPLQ